MSQLNAKIIQFDTSPLQNTTRLLKRIKSIHITKSTISEIQIP